MGSVEWDSMAASEVMVAIMVVKTMIPGILIGHFANTIEKQG